MEQIDLHVKNQFRGNHVNFKNYYFGINLQIIDSLRNNNYYWRKCKLLLLFWSPLCKAGREWGTPSVQRPQPHTTIPWKEEKDKTVGDKEERADHANRKALALLLKPARPTPSNTGSLRSLQRETERAQSFCDTEKSYNEEARTSACEQPKHHE